MRQIRLTKSKKVVIYQKNNLHENDENAFKLYHKVRYHCNYTGKYRGAAHNICSLR